MYRVWIFLLAACALASAQGTQVWRQSRFEDFQKGTAKGVAVLSNGTLELAPEFRQLATTPSSYIWAIASDAQGNAYVAAGLPARVYRVDREGKLATLFAPGELQVQALAVDASGVVYAATSPDGKVYKLTRSAAKQAKPRAAEATASQETAQQATDPAWSSEVFFEPKTKYIWDLKLDAEGRLYVATGDRGEIFRVEKDGKGTRFFKSDEAHIRSMVFDRQGNLIAGSDGSGLVYRITPQGEGFVLFSAPKKEITALAVDARNNIYAAGSGDKRPGSNVPPASLVVPLQIAPQNPAAPGAQPPIQQPVPFTNLARGSEIYVIAPESTPRRLWSTREDLVYALGFDAQGRLLAGSGNNGRVYRIDGRNEYADLLKASASQVSGFATAPEGGLLVATSNLGKVFLLGNKPGDEGTFESDVFDARVLSRWGRAEVRGRGNFDVYTRSGNVDNPDRNWSPWKAVEDGKDTPIEAPAARFVQWRAVLRPAKNSTQLESVGIFYRANNVAPVVEEVFVQPGARFNIPPRAVESTSVSVGPSTQALRVEAPTTAVRDRGYVAVRWNASDDNDDELTYALYYRGDDEQRWKLLKDEISDRAYSFESAMLPDGGYTVRVVASDSRSRGPEEALTDARESARFEIDSTPPRIEDLEAKIEGGQLHVSFRVRDTFSPIRRAEYSIDAGEWRMAEPVGQLSDSRQETYDFTLPAPQAAMERVEQRADGKKQKDESLVREHVVVVRVFDRFDNLASAKVVVKD